MTDILGGGVGALHSSNNRINEIDNNTWGLGPGIEIPADANLDNYKTVGNYYCILNTSVESVINKPPIGKNKGENGFKLKVEELYGWAFGLRQIFIYSLDGEAFARRYDRSSSKWESWILLTPQLSDIYMKHFTVAVTVSKVNEATEVPLTNAPSDFDIYGEVIPVIIGHSSINNTMENIFFDTVGTSTEKSRKLFIVSSVAQRTNLRIYYRPKN